MNDNALLLLPGIYQHLFVFTLYFIRLVSFFLTFSIFHRELVTARLSLSLSFILAAYLLFLQPIPPIANELTLATVLLAFSQFLIGFASGIFLNIMLMLFFTVGQLISLQIGLSIANIFDPTTGMETILGKFYLLTGMLLFLLLDGHLYTLNVIYKSFELYPLNSFFIPSKLMAATLYYFQHILSNAFMLAITITIVMFLTNVSLVMMGRFGQQFNLFSIGINMQLIIGLICMWMTFDLMINEGQSILYQGINEVRLLITVPAHGR
jgi:flagellar biosynthesis protein FliR